MDDERLLFSDGAWHRGQRQRIPFETACYYTHEPELPHGCQQSRSLSDEWRDSPARIEEKSILLSLYTTTGGSTGGWRADDNWDENTDPCWDQWYGITCNEHGRVIAIELADNGLTGQLPGNLGRMTSLVKIDFSTSQSAYHSHPNEFRNRLTGSVPSLSQLERLEEIEVSGNELTSLPDDLWRNGPTLRSLSASHNLITKLPSFLRRFIKLHTLELGNNLIQGSFPTDMGGMVNARFVHLQYNQLTGKITDDIVGMSRIRVLDVSHNPGLGGEIPEVAIVDWAEADYLSIMNTSLSGYIAQLCSDVPFCWRFMYDTHADLTWAVAGDVPDIVGEALGLAQAAAAAAAEEAAAGEVAGA